MTVAILSSYHEGLDTPQQMQVQTAEEPQTSHTAPEVEASEQPRAMEI